MDYLQTAAELGEALVGTPQFAHLESARAALEEDVPAQVLLQGLEDITAELAAFRKRGEKIPAETTAKVHKLNDRLAANQSFKEYRQAQAAFEEVLGQVKAVLEEKTGAPFQQGCGGGGCPHKRA